MSGLDDENNGDTEGEEDLESTDEAQEGLDEEESFDDEIGEGADDYDEGDEDLKAVDEALSHRDQNARALAIRRAIEERLEAKRLSQDLDYLDLDLDDDD
tara:strand:- start:572 stop:871 length:300 start_codon:yes stop_codon:yes gene_type:complete